jgi:hypothetical protein
MKLHYNRRFIICAPVLSALFLKDEKSGKEKLLTGGWFSDERVLFTDAHHGNDDLVCVRSVLLVNKAILAVLTCSLNYYGKQ